MSYYLESPAHWALGHQDSVWIRYIHVNVDWAVQMYLCSTIVCHGTMPHVPALSYGFVMVALCISVYVGNVLRCFLERRRQVQGHT